MIVTNKTPYELRMELLNFAQSQLQGEYFSLKDQILSTTPENSEERKKKFDELVFPTTKRIIELANEFKAFVDGK